MRRGPAAQHLCCRKPAELVPMVTCRAATAALGGQETYYSHLPLDAPENADQPQPWQWPQAPGLKELGEYLGGPSTPPWVQLLSSSGRSSTAEPWSQMLPAARPWA